MSTQHTPGPWAVQETDVYCGDESLSPGGVLFRASYRHSNHEADLRLAAAAPELLEALQLALRHATAINDGTLRITGRDSCGNDTVTIRADVFDVIRAAIAKATL